MIFSLWQIVFTNEVGFEPMLNTVCMYRSHTNWQKQDLETFRVSGQANYDEIIALDNLFFLPGLHFYELFIY